MYSAATKVTNVAAASSRSYQGIRPDRSWVTTRERASEVELIPTYTSGRTSNAIKFYSSTTKSNTIKQTTTKIRSNAARRASHRDTSGAVLPENTCDVASTAAITTGTQTGNTRR